MREDEAQSAELQKSRAARALLRVMGLDRVPVATVGLQYCCMRCYSAATLLQRKGRPRCSCKRKTLALKRKLDKLQTQLLDVGADKGIVRDEIMVLPLQAQLHDNIRKVLTQQREWNYRKKTRESKQDEPGKRWAKRNI